MKILCVCTGNTCRSPMLAALLLREITRRHPGRTIVVESAGTGAGTDQPASAETIACMAEEGLDLTRHRSRQLDNLDLAAFDRVLCMTSGHAAYVRSRGVPAARLEVVDALHGGVPDPFGGSRADYQACAAVLGRFARTWELPQESTAVDNPAYLAARAALDQAHAGDPQLLEGKPYEWAYAERLEHWVLSLEPSPSLALRLASRCQHLERWAIPRSDFAQDKAGYFAWRKAVQKRQGQRTIELLSAAGCTPDLTSRVAHLVAKAAPKGDREGQVLEDAACLVFIETELETFAAAHSDYTREKFIDIIRKTWRKMSPDGQRFALALPLPAAIAELIKAAVAP